MTIHRYHTDYTSPTGMTEFDDGDYVLFTDHEKELNRLKARLNELDEELTGWVKSHDDLNRRLIAMTEFYEG